jgi:hypothetical protein
VFVARGPAIRRAQNSGPLSLIDVAPTVLYTLDLAIPSDLEGRIATEIFVPEHLSLHAAKSGQPTEHAVASDVAAPRRQEAEIIERMKALGYLE